MLNRLSFLAATVMFIAYAVLNGVTCSVYFLAFTSESIASTFFITAGTFGALSLYGMFTKRDLSSIGLHPVHVAHRSDYRFAAQPVHAE